ncbi:MAG: chlorite dismutase family protein [Myxococcales bacterium]|nr:chlorite dismutase family protein [Myxococcales bacterium]MCB9707362.1 chlorite dismutase family protein [Myxococcales bacterium]
MERPRRDTKPDVRPHKVDVLEHGAAIGGEPQSMDRRLFMQLSVYRAAPSLEPKAALSLLRGQLEAIGALAVLYRDVHDPRSIGLLTWHTLAARLVELNQALFSTPGTEALTLRPEFSMFGRTYSSGFEPDLHYWLIDRPQQTVLNSEWPWAIWYPLKRKGSFEQLAPEEQRAVLGEHARLGKTYGEQDLAHDVRLVCHGLDQHDNDFVIGLTGKELQPLSHVVQAMRKTRQTSEFIQSMGPFFLGYTEWRNAGRPPSD